MATPTRPVDRRSGKTLRAPHILRQLCEDYDGGVVELDWRTPFELLVATVLSAQSTDRKVNEITPALFARLPDPAAFVAVERSELEGLIYQTGFYRQKAKTLQALAAQLLAAHDGQVPASMAELIALPGVARKTANVVASAAFPDRHARDPDAGIAVDTHVARLARRFRFTRATDPVQIERDLMRLIPREQWAQASLSIILHGRRVCAARRPCCADCGVEPLCPSSLAAGCRDKAGQAVAMGGLGGMGGMGGLGGLGGRGG